ncbi:MAG TPA: cytochrome C oxidase subunit IV family protein [Tepidisphaeraceae bacterium]
MSIPVHSTETQSTSHAGDGAVHPHIVSPAVLLGVYGVLVVLTIATVAVTSVDLDKFHLGKLNILVALSIAVVKAACVVLWFMHLRYDSPFNAVVFITALFFVAVFLGFAMMDTGEYKPNDEPPGTRIMVTSQNGG